MNARPVDPRDITSEYEPLAYRVYFWKVKTTEFGEFSTSYEYEITGAKDVAEVIEWANQNAAGRTYTLYVRFTPRSEERSVIQLLGVDPTRPGS
jgi:hypothetical protein